ncbi:DUF2863 family protein [Niveibacterium terrae]|uniref:DUF2863 family protein n=1 Tax=Niveibacterium terrae TaxID=3373598 RepID=UPI003A910445
MKRSRFSRRSSGLSPEAEQLVWLASGLSESGCRAEDRFWETRLATQIEALLDEGDEETLNAAMDHLFTANPRAYDELADALESLSESSINAQTGDDLLLIAAPVMAWSRFSIPAMTLAAPQLASLRVHLQAHVFADGVKLALADFMFSPDQLPQGYCDTRRFALALGEAARAGHDLKVSRENMPETVRFLSDVRYLLAAVVVPAGQPLFRWQENDSSREQALAQWRAQGGAVIATLMPGCACDIVLPEAYFAASRQADRESRPYSLRASVAFLTTTLEVPPGELRAVIAPYHDKQLEEYRIAFTQTDSDKVVHGVVWPLLGAEDETSEIAQQIETALRECGLDQIQHLENRFPLEYCDDCGSPMYPSPEGESVHAELPEEKAESIPRHLH